MTAWVGDFGEGYHRLWIDIRNHLRGCFFMAEIKSKIFFKTKKSSARKIEVKNQIRDRNLIIRRVETIVKR
jgi:hypothetical protein